MTEVDLESVRGEVEILRWVKEQQAKLKDAEKNARAAIEAAMGNAEVGLLDGEPAISWPTFKENRFDSSGFRADNPEMWEQYKAAQERRRFEVL